MDEQREVIDTLKEYFSKQEKISLAFVFGSFTKSKTHHKGDIDIAIEFNKEYNINDIDEIWLALEKILNKDVDLVILNEARPTIIWTAIRGIPLLIRNYKYFLEYMLKISSEAEDFCNYVIDFWKLKTKIKKW